MMDPEHLTDEGWSLPWVTAAFCVIALVSAMDILWDLTEGATSSHVLTEAVVAFSGLLGFSISARKLALVRLRAREAEQEVVALDRQLCARMEEVERWRGEARDALRGLGVAIDRQFARWGLTEAEKEVGLLLLKGLSHKEVADVRGISVGTARQQARSVYRKAGLTGRSELAGFFLEDLLLPPEE